MTVANGKLTGKRIAILATDGFEESELVRPRDRFVMEGAEVVLVSNVRGPIQGVRHGETTEALSVDLEVHVADASTFDALLLPGGMANPDSLRTDPDVIAFVRAFGEAKKPIAAICHAAWTLIEAGLVKGRRMTSWPSLRTDLENAGATWQDHEVVRDHELVTSRMPEDIPAFVDAAIEVFAKDPVKPIAKVAPKPRKARVETARRDERSTH